MLENGLKVITGKSKSECVTDMIKLILILKDKYFDQFFEGTFDQFEDCFFSFTDGLSIEQKIEAVKSWAKMPHNNYHVEIKDGSRIYA